MKAPTPETDALIARHVREQKKGGSKWKQVLELVEHARNMERQRDAAMQIKRSH